MKKNNTLRRLAAFLAIVIVLMLTMVPVFAAGEAEGADAAASSLSGMKAIAAGIAITLPAGLGALGMGIATGKTAEAVAHQPEAEGKIRSSFMLGLVFTETAIIYALLVVILIIFVL